MKWRFLGVCASGIAAVAGAGLFACSISVSGESATEGGMDGSLGDVEVEVAADTGTDSTLMSDVANDGEGGTPDILDAMSEDVVADVADVASGDAAEEEAGPPTCGNWGGACCGSEQVSRFCTGCDAGALFCPYSFGWNSPGYCIGDCSNCVPGGSPAPVTCYVCGGGGVEQLCAAHATDCPTTKAAGACSCSPEAGDCPGGDQVCTEIDGGQFICLTP